MYKITLLWYNIIIIKQQLTEVNNYENRNRKNAVKGALQMGV